MSLARAVADALAALLPDLGPVSVEVVALSPESVAYLARWAGVEAVVTPAKSTPVEEVAATLAAKLHDKMDP